MDSAHELHSGDDRPIIGPCVGVDYGSKRIGLSVTDPDQRFAMPADVLAGSRNPDSDARAVAAWGAERRVGGYVVGLPLNMDGTAGRQAEISRHFASCLSNVSGLPVRLADERLTSFQADQWLAEAGTSPGRAKGTPQRDALAALAILEAYLNQIRPPAGLESGPTGSGD